MPVLREHGAAPLLADLLCQLAQVEADCRAARASFTSAAGADPLSELTRTQREIWLAVRDAAASGAALSDLARRRKLGAGYRAGLRRLRALGLVTGEGRAVRCVDTERSPVDRVMEAPPGSPVREAVAVWVELTRRRDRVRQEVQREVARAGVAGRAVSARRRTFRIAS